MSFAWQKPLTIRNGVIESAAIVAVVEVLMAITRFDFNRSQEATSNRIMLLLLIGWIAYLPVLIWILQKWSGGTRARVFAYSALLLFMSAGVLAGLLIVW